MRIRHQRARATRHTYGPSVTPHAALARNRAAPVPAPGIAPAFAGQAPAVGVTDLVAVKIETQRFRLTTPFSESTSGPVSAAGAAEVEPAHGPRRVAATRRGSTTIAQDKAGRFVSMGRGAGLSRRTY